MERSADGRRRRAGRMMAPGHDGPAGYRGLRLLVAEHEADCPAGLLERWAAARGITLTTARVAAGVPLPPDMTAFDGLVVLGSEHTAYDDSLPWLRDELSLVERSLAAEVPVLGICFGGQVLARVLGARLYRLPVPEIGWIEVASRLPGIAAGPWLAWHRDAFDLPPGATELAAGEVSLQAFAAGPHLGLQFHPEVTRPIIECWLAGVDSPVAPEIAGPMAGAAAETWDSAAEHAAALFSAWFDGTARGTA